jgi:hypothetical protein
MDRLISDYLEYNPIDGIIKWKKDKCRMKKGMIAGYKTKTGYTNIIFNRKSYKAHRIAWVLYYGDISDMQIDHINHNRSDNRLCNLRCVTQQENKKNKSLQKRNKSGHTGVYWSQIKNKWYAVIGVSGKQICLGHFVNKNDAVTARELAEERYLFHKNHGKGS